MKKRKFGLLAIMSSMALGLMLGACGSNNEPEQPDPEVPGPVEPEKPNPQPEKPEELPAKYDLMKYWSGHMEETVYEVVESDAKTTINYTDVKGENAGGWEYVARSFQYDIANLARFGEYKTLTFTGKLTKTAGTDIVMVKIEGTDGNTLERKFNFGPESKTYELNLGTIKDWSKVNTLLLFANRGTSEMGSGSMEFTEFALSKAETNPDNDIAADLPKVPQDVNLYNGGDKLVVMNSWGYDNKGAIKTEAKDGGYLFTYGEGSKATEEWAYVSARVKSGTKDLATSGLTRIHFKLKGTKGTNALVKFEGLNGLGAKEFMISNLTGEFEEYDLDITELVKKTHEDGSTPEFIAAVFPAAGRKGADLAGEVFLAECFLDKTPAVDPNDRFINHQEGDKVAVKVLQNNEATYTIASEGNNHTVTYKLANVPDFRAIKVLTAGETLNELTELAFTAKSTSKVQIIVKAYDNAGTETKIDLEPNVEKAVKINFAKEVVDPKKPTVIMIGTSADSALEGVITFTNVVFQKSTAVPTLPTNKVENNRIRINKFHSYNKDHYTIAQNGNVTKIDFDKPNTEDWVPVKFTLEDANLKDYTLMTGKVKATVNTSIIIKPYDSNEVKFEPLEANKEYTINKVLEGFDTTKDGLIFIGFGNDTIARKGTIEIFDLQLRKNLPYCEPANNEILINKFHSFKAEHYTITQTGEVTKIDFDKPNTEDWVPVKFTVDGENLGHYNYLTGKVKATVNTSIIVKPYDSNEVKFEPLEANKEYTIAKVLEGFDTTKDGLIFIGFGNDTIARKGTIEITGLKLTHYVPYCEPEGEVININKFFDYNKEIYTITTEGTKTTIKFKKAPANDWDSIKFAVKAADLSVFTKLTGTVTVSVKTSFIVKPYDANEVKVEPLEANKPYTIDKALTAIDGNKFGHIFVGFSGSDVKEGTITFENLQLTK